MIKVAVADDHKILREGITKIINDSTVATVVAEADSVAEVKRILEKKNFIDVLVCDINFQDGDGYEVLDYCKKFNKKVKVILLSIHDQSPYATKAIEAGAMGYLTKDSSKEELLLAIQNAVVGKKFLSQSIMSNIVENLNKPRKDKSYFASLLSKRELEVLELVVAGLDTNEIAEKLFISDKTAANYRVSILQKCGAKNVVQLIKLYTKHS